MKLQLDADELRPIVQLAVEEAWARVEEQRAKLNGRLAYTEPEAAALIGVQPHVLRDCRRRGELVGRLVGKRMVYSREELTRFLDGGSGRLKGQ